MKSMRSKHSHHAALFVLWLIATFLLVYPIGAWVTGNLSLATAKATLGIAYGALLLTGVVLVSGEARR